MGRGEKFRVGEWLVIPAENRIAGTNRRSCHVSPKAMDVLVCLAGGLGAVRSKDELLTQVWGTRFISQGVLANAVRELRNALGDNARHPRFIETIPKRGYRLVQPPAEPAPAGPPPANRQPRRPRIWLASVVLILVGGTLGLWTGITRAPAPARLAVLDFQDLTPAPGDPAFTHGMTAMLITEMARLKGLRVISGSGADHLTELATADDFTAVARRLGAQLLLQGTVLRADGHVRVTVRLVKGATGRDVWGGSFESDLADVPGLQRDVARAVAREMRLELRPGERTSLARARDVNPAALLEYTKGLHLYDQWDDGQSLKRSVVHFQRAIDLDPRFAPARAHLARSLVALAMVEQLAPADVYVRARNAARAALRLDDQLADAHAALALVRLLLEWDFKGAEAQAVKALELNPSSVFGYETLSLVYVAEGRMRENLIAMQRAHALAPLNYYANLRLAWSYYRAGRYRESVAVLKSTLELYPEKRVPHLFLASDYALLRQPAEAVTQCAASGFACIWVRTHLGLDNPLEADPKKYLAQKFVPARLRSDRTRLAAALADLGDADDAFSSLERAVDEGRPDVALFSTNPMLWPLHSDPRWAALMRRISGGSPVARRANAAN